MRAPNVSWRISCRPATVGRCPSLHDRTQRPTTALPAARPRSFTRLPPAAACSPCSPRWGSWPPPVSRSTAQQPAVASYRLEAGYDVAVRLDWDARRVDVETTITLRNTSGGPVDRLELNTVAAKLGVDARPPRRRGRWQRCGPRSSDRPSRCPSACRSRRTPRPVSQVDFRAKLQTTTAGAPTSSPSSARVAQLYRVIPWLSRAIPFGRQGPRRAVPDAGQPARRGDAAARTGTWSGRPLVAVSAATAPASETHRASDVRDFVITASPAIGSHRGRHLRDGQTHHRRLHSPRSRRPLDRPWRVRSWRATRS